MAAANLKHLDCARLDAIGLTSHDLLRPGHRLSTHTRQRERLCAPFVDDPHVHAAARQRSGAHNAGRPCANLQLGQLMQRSRT